RFHAPVINVSTPVENNLRDTLGLGALGNGFTYGFRSRQIAAGSTRSLLAFRAVRRDQSHTLQVVDDLHVDVVQRTVHIEPRPLGGSEDLFANALVHPAASYVLR